MLSQRTAGEVSAGWRSPGPFEPVALRVFPLTRVERDAAGAAQIVLHLELKDEWGDTVKGVGALTVQLLRPAGVASGGGRDEVRWDVSLWGAEENARYYDPSSRTYRIVLGDVPGWVDAMMSRSDPEDRVRITAQLRTPTGDGSMRSLWDELELRP